MPFRVPKIKGCCCLSLATGSKIIGGLHMTCFVLVIAFPLLNSAWFHVVSSLQIIIYETLFLNFGWFAVVMLYGAIKKDHVLMFPWIIFHTAVFLMFLNSILVQIIYFGLMDDRHDFMVFETVISLVEAYSLMVVYNHYREIKEQRPEPAS